jgi:hypothetical protein
MAMTFLQLVQRLKRECGVSGSDPATLQGTLPAEITRLANWVSEAWQEVQRERADWFFLRQPVSFTATAAAGRSYTPTQAGIPLLASYKLDAFRCYAAALGQSNEQILPWLPYDSFRNLYLFGANAQVQARPTLFSVDPQKNLVLGPAPNEDYVIAGEAFLAPQPLVNDADTPSMPSQFHMLVVYKAMEYYGAYDNAPEVYERGKAQYGPMLVRLTIDQAPQFTFGGALA